MAVGETRAITYFTFLRSESQFLNARCRHDTSASHRLLFMTHALNTDHLAVSTHNPCSLYHHSSTIHLETFNDDGSGNGERKRNSRIWRCPARRPCHKDNDGRGGKHPRGGAQARERRAYGPREGQEKGTWCGLERQRNAGDTAQVSADLVLGWLKVVSLIGGIFFVFQQHEARLSWVSTSSPDLRLQNY